MIWVRSSASSSEYPSRFHALVRAFLYILCSSETLTCISADALTSSVSADGSDTFLFTSSADVSSDVLSDFICFLLFPGFFSTLTGVIICVPITARISPISFSISLCVRAHTVFARYNAPWISSSSGIRRLHSSINASASFLLWFAISSSQLFRISDLYPLKNLSISIHTIPLVVLFFT